MVVTKGVLCGGNVPLTKSPKTNDTYPTEKQQQNEQNEVSLVALVLAAIRKSVLYCRVHKREDDNDDDHDDDVVCAFHEMAMDIGWPTNVRHVTHVTFDRFHGFLGLPDDLQVDIPKKVPSASASVFGVSAESMQCSYDTNGNSVPIILLLLQERLYSQSGLKAEGVFRINPENDQEEWVRDQLNMGIVPNDIDVHCLAGLIKSWFRELPRGVLDGLSPEQVLQCNSEEDYYVLVKQLKPTETALLNWAIDLMADVVEEEDFNKMNARNIAMVFAPNMTQMSDPLTALMHAVQVMNLLKTLITKTLREREEAPTENYSPMSSRSLVQENDEEYGIQQEKETDCDSRGPVSDCDEFADYSHNREIVSGDEGGSLSDIEKCFLGQSDENKMSTQNDEDANISNCDSKTWICQSNGTSNGVESRQERVVEGQFLDSISFSGKHDNERNMELDQLLRGI